MTLSAIHEYRQYRVPQDSGASLVEPGIEEIESLLGAPISIGGAGDLEFCGKPLDAVRRQAREEVVQLAVAHTRKYTDVNVPTTENIAQRALVLSGHQPELFHPGVWFKNFLLARLAAERGAIAINFLVDNDLCRSTSIRVPSLGDTGQVTLQTAAFDSHRDSIPWELRSLNSASVWEQFPDVVQSRLIPHSTAPLVREIWPSATQALRRSGKLGLALAEARHQLELDCGLKTLEVPLSHLVGTRAFARFSIHLLAELPRFHEVYNSQRDLYRTAHRIRNSAHPVPRLEQTHGWIEAPWWVYRPAAPYRQPLWVRQINDQLVLSDRAGWQAIIEGRLDCDNASTQWLDLLADGICIRPRALLTTMYLRLIVGDLFVHGIGGGKYDQLTDAIMREFFCVEPPPMVVATATLRLPHLDPSLSDGARDIDEQIQSARQQLWRLRYHPEETSYVPASDEGNTERAQLSERKSALLKNIPAKGEKWQWHRELTAINRGLNKLTEDQTQSVKLEIENLLSQQRTNRILTSREYSFCLYSRDYVVEQLKSLALL